MEQYYRPESVSDACRHLATYEGDAELIAGGQTLTLHLRQGLKDPDQLVDISHLDELREVTVDDDEVTIGSAITYAELRRNESLAAELPFFVEALGNISGPQVRHNGTIGGGLCYGDPALDSPPLLLTLDAVLTAASDDGTREIPIDEFYTAYYETALRDDEILTEITFSNPSDDSAGAYRTMTPRQGDYAVAGVAVRLAFDGETCSTARVALTNAADTPLRATDAERALVGTAVDQSAVDEAVQALRESLDLIGDEQVSKSYKETVFQRIAKQTIRDVRADLEEAT
jgi:carbon-monoxide dehydrogenase medium subunit